ncbi:MAG: NFACT family protein, partial [Clostridiales bacterium]
MAFDSFALTAALNQLQQIGMDARIGKIHQPDKHTILLRFHGPMGAGRLLISAHPEQGRLQLTEIVRENPAQAPLFTMVLRKWLDGAKITRIEQTPGERVAIITLLTRNDIGDPITCKLISEIMGKHSNIILVNECDVIIDGIHRYNSNLSRYRQVLPGQPYIPPPPMHKLPLDQVDEENLGLLLFQQAELTVRELLLQQVGGLSPLFAASCCYQSNITPTTLCGELGLAEIRRLCQHLNDLANAAAAANFHPTLLLKAGKPEDFAAFLPGEWENLPHRSIADISQAIDTLYLSKEQERLFNLKQRELKKLFQHHITRLNKKISLQEEDLRQSEAADRYKQAGDLLSAYQYDLRKGVSEAELPIFDDPHQTIKIKLNPALTPQENISRYYHRYSKAKNARSTIEEHLEANRQELN